MGFAIDQVVPWGRNLAEYQQKFSLRESELALRILGCADGPASVNAELHQQERNYVSLDPIYRFSAKQIKSRIEETARVIAKQLEENRTDYLWDYHESPQRLVQVRRKAMDAFLADFAQHQSTERYVNGALPHLPFADCQFDLVLCSHCLFTYSEQLDEAFHRQAVSEMSRVGREVRIFPLLDMNGQPSRHVDSVLKLLKGRDMPFEITTVDYEFQRGGNQLLTIKTL